MEGVVSFAKSPVGFIVIGVVFCALFLYVFVGAFTKKSRKRRKDSAGKASDSREPSNKQSAVNKSVGSSVVKPHKKVFRAAKHQFSSPDLISTFKGHTEQITSGAISANGKGLVTSAKDRTLFFYNLRDAFTSGGSAVSVQGSRTNIAFDHVDRLCWSPDYGAVVVHMAESRAIEVLKGTKKSDGTLSGLNKVREFGKKFPERLVGLSVASNGKFIMTCTCSNLLSVWDLRGDLLASVDTKQGHTLHATLSIDDKFLVTAGFTPDVKVFEVVYDKAGDFKSLRRAFELTGHNSRVFCSHINPDSSRMVTISKDGTWKLYNTNVDYIHGQSPTVEVTGLVPEARTVSDERPCLVRLSPDGRVVLAAVGSSVYCYSAASAALVHTVQAVYAGAILDVFFDAGNQFFVTLGDQCAHLFNNVAGHHATIQDLEMSLKGASYSGLRERIKSQLETAKAALQKLDHSKKGSGEQKPVPVQNGKNIEQNSKKKK